MKIIYEIKLIFAIALYKKEDKNKLNERLFEIKSVFCVNKVKSLIKFNVPKFRFST